MKICWDNLEKLKFDKVKLILRDKYNNIYHFHEKCPYCGEPFLGGTLSIYCSKSCVHKGKPKSETTKKKMSISGKKKVFTKEHRRNISKAVSGEKNGFYGKKHTKEAKNIIREKNKNKILPEDFGEKQRINKTYLAKDYKIKHSFFYKVEEIRDNPNDLGIQVRCKNNKCENSKEKGGWFTPTGSQVTERIRQLEHPDGRGDGNYFYCSDKCKKECILYHLHGDPYKENNLPYTQAEYNTCRAVVFERENGLCEYCGEPATDIHHIYPVKLEPFFALDPDYCVACCEKHHYEYAHQDECSTGNLSKIVCSVESQKFLNQQGVINDYFNT